MWMCLCLLKSGDEPIQFRRRTVQKTCRLVDWQRSRADNARHHGITSEEPCTGSASTNPPTSLLYLMVGKSH